MKIFIFANCQGKGIEIFLSSLLEIYGNFEFLHIENYGFLNNDNHILKYREFISRANVFIYQPLNWMNDDLTVRYTTPVLIENLLSDSCERISFPYIYNNALWPIVIEGNKGISSAQAIQIINQARSLDEINKIYDSGGFDFQFPSRLGLTASILGRKEKDADIIISDYIYNNISKKMLFLTQNHPTSDLFIECARRIYEVLIDRTIIKRKEINIEGKFRSVPINLTNLPGYWPIDHYSYQFFKFEWPCNDLENAGFFYKNIMKMMWINVNSQERIIAEREHINM